MTSTKLIKKLKLSATDFETIRQAVQDSEMRTNGEIALAATVESSDYSFFELFTSVLLGAVTFALMLPLYTPIHTMLDSFFWEVPLWYMIAFYGIASFAVIALFFIVANIPSIDRLIIPHIAQHKAVYQRALRHFVESGVYGTKDRTGILIFISYMEREVRIIADSGINAKIEQSQWDTIAQKIADGIRLGETVISICTAVKECGDLLEAHFPAQKENPNELVDGLMILEAGK